MTITREKLGQMIGVKIRAYELETLIANVASHAHKKGDLPVLNSVKLWADNGRLYATATDRYRLIEGSIELEEGTDFAPILVSLTDSKRVIFLAREVAESFISLHRAGDLLTVSAEGNSLTLTGVDGTFPPTDHLFIAGTPTATDSFTVNPAFLADYAKIIGKRQPLTITSRGEGKPLSIGGLPEGYRALVMPMKVR